MTSRIRRIFLIDGKTSGVTTSKQICEIQLPGGAAITGVNGVGKTTSLQLLPLFFGTLPSEILSKGPTVQPMLDFMLPNTSSAIAFEYQRGSAPEDVRLVVLRKQAVSSAPEYRLFRSGFRPEFFMRAHGEDGAMRFLDDAESARMAGELGVVVEAKVSASHYRHVILNTRSPSKDVDQIRKHAREYSFAHRQLPYLDRIMSAIARETVDFKDLISLIVSIVQDGDGTERAKKVELKSMRSQMEAWIANRQACEVAVNLTPRVSELSRSIDAYRAHENTLGSLSLDVTVLRDLLSVKVNSLTEQISERDAKRSDARKSEQYTLESLGAAVNRSETELASCVTELSLLKNRSEHLSKEDAAFWHEKVKDLPHEEQKAADIRRNESLAKSKAADIVREIEERVSQMREVTSIESEKFELEKSAPRQNNRLSLEKLMKDQRDAHEHMATQHKDALDIEDAKIEGLLEAQATAKATLNAPQDDPEQLQALDEAQALLSKLNDALEASRIQEQLSQNARHEARLAQTKAANANTTAVQSVALAQSALHDVTLKGKPKKGTLLADLMASKDQSWRDDFARVINPNILELGDLEVSSPQDADATDTIFGWRLKSSALQLPSWANAELHAQEIANASERLTLCTEVQQKTSAELEASMRAMNVAQGAWVQAEALLSVAKNKQLAQLDAVQARKNAIASMRVSAKDRALAQVAQVGEQLRVARKERETLTQTQRLSLTQSNNLVENMRIELNEKLDDEIRAIDARREAYKKAQNHEIQKQLDERDRRLVNAGVDVEYVNQLGRDRLQADLRISELTGKLPLAREWSQWLEEDGQTKLTLKAKEEGEIRQHLGGSKDVLAGHKKSMELAETEHKKTIGALRNVMDGCQSDSSKLELLSQRLISHTYNRGMASLVTLDMPASQLEGLVNGALKSHERQESEIVEKGRSVETKLITGSNSVSHLISAVIAQESIGIELGRVERARIVCNAFEQITEQVVAPLHTELGTILETLMSFKQQVKRFEAGVKGFDGKLQAGIGGVVNTFERLRDFKINVVTTFSELGFLNQLDALSDIVREFRANSHMSTNRDVPKADIGVKLRSVISTIGDGHYELELGKYITLSGSFNDNGAYKPFYNEQGLKTLSSTGITAIAMITLLAGLLNVVRGTEDIWLPWGTDEIGRFDASNFGLLMEMLAQNKVDVLTASPTLSATAYGHFKHRYLFKPGSVWAVYSGANERLQELNQSLAPSSPATEHGASQLEHPPQYFNDSRPTQEQTSKGFEDNQGASSANEGIQ